MCLEVRRRSRKETKLFSEHGVFMVGHYEVCLEAACERTGPQGPPTLCRQSENKSKESKEEWFVGRRPGAPRRLWKAGCPWSTVKS